MVPAPGAPPPSARAPGAPHGALVLLFCISFLQYVDRWSVAAVLTELQAQPAADGGGGGGFGLDDTASGLVSTVFVVTYMLLSPVFGFLGDRMPRIPLIYCGSILYAASVFCGSYARFYSQFLLFRALVGVGEASFSVLAPTLIADWYPAGPERTTALGFFCVSLPLGAAAGFIYAGEIARVLGWRYAFRISPILSFIFTSVLLATVAEPQRGGSDSAAVPRRSVSTSALPGAPDPAPKSVWLRDVRSILSTPSYILSTLGAVGMTFTSGALAQWAPAFLQRVNCPVTDAVGSGACTVSVTRTFGLLTMFSGVIGTVGGSRLSLVYGRRNEAADAVVCAAGLLLATPCVYFAIWAAPRLPGLPTWAAVFVGETLVSVVWAPNQAILLSVVSPHCRSTANAMSLLMTHLFGDSMSPVLIGAYADWLHTSKNQLSKAIALQSALYMSVLSTIVASFFFYAAGLYLEADRARAASGDYQVVDGGEEGDGGEAVAADGASKGEMIAGGENFVRIAGNSAGGLDVPENETLITASNIALDAT